MGDFDLSPDLYIDNSWFFPKPLSISKRHSSGLSFSADAELSPERMCWFKRGDNHLQVYKAQCLLNRHILGHFGPQWLQSDGLRWACVPEDGMLDLDTELALKHFQLKLNWPQSGCLCPKTRAFLPPLLRLKGSLLRKRLKMPNLCLPHKYYGGSSSTSTSSGSSSPTLQTNKTTNKTDTPVKTTGNTPPPTGKKDDDDDDKPWTLTITPNWGFGGAAPLWTSRSGTGASVKKDTLEVDQKTEIDVSLPTSWALGMGKLKFTIGGEYDVPVDSAHLGKASIVGNFQLQADDLLKNDYVSFSPYLKYSPQWTNDNGLKESNQFKAGAEVDFDLQKILGLDKAFKGLKATVDVNSGVQTPGGGNDPATTAKAIVPLEGNLNLTWDLPVHTF